MWTCSCHLGIAQITLVYKMYVLLCLSSPVLLFTLQPTDEEFGDQYTQPIGCPLPAGATINYFNFIIIALLETVVFILTLVAGFKHCTAYHPRSCYITDHRGIYVHI